MKKMKKVLAVALSLVMAGRLHAAAHPQRQRHLRQALLKQQQNPQQRAVLRRPVRFQQTARCITSVSAS